MKTRALALVTVLALPTLALAQSPTPPSPDRAQPSQPSQPTQGAPTTPNPPSPTPTMTDKPRTEKAAKLADADVKIMAHQQHVNKMEIDLGKLAQKNGSAAVKNYAEALEKDHTTANKDLMAFAKQRKLAAIPADKPQTEADKQEHKTMMASVARIKQIKGPEFDREFLTMMVQDHDKELAKIDVAIGNATDPDLQALLKAVKPVLQRHSDQARDLQKTVTTSSNQAPSPGTSPSQSQPNQTPSQPPSSPTATGDKAPAAPPPSADMQPPRPPSQLPSEKPAAR